MASGGIRRDQRARSGRGLPLGVGEWILRVGEHSFGEEYRVAVGAGGNRQDQPARLPVLTTQRTRRRGQFGEQRLPGLGKYGIARLVQTGGEGEFEQRGPIGGEPDVGRGEGHQLRTRLGDRRHRGAVVLTLFGEGAHDQGCQQRVAINVVLVRRGHTDPGPPAHLGHGQSADPLGAHQIQRGLLQHAGQVSVVMPAATFDMPDVDFGLAVHHTNLSVADLDAQRAWYQEALGLHEVIEEFQLDEPPVRTIVLRSASGVHLELIERAGASRPRAYTDPLDAASTLGYGHWAVSVRDLDEAFAAIVAAGGDAVWPPADAVQPGARFAYIKDPEGNLIELIQPAPVSPGPSAGR